MLLAVALGSTGIAASSFPRIFDTEAGRGRPLPPDEAAAQITVPPGFRATLFAGEPDVRQPIAMATDARGRLWVAENYTYSEQEVGFHPDLRDRIVILEDSDNDGRFDRRTVFWEDAQRLTSIEVGFGGVWALALPHLIFIPDRDGNDVPDAAPEIVLEGFEYMRSRHNVANGLRWGPDGWLYGRHGILGVSHVGRPGTPRERLQRVNVGIWRYHPQHGVFEVVAHGTTNPWGMDWNAEGEGFFINTVIGHLWHLIAGAHYRRMFGDDPNPATYELIDQHADHVHWATGEEWQDVRKGVTDATLAAGGGHAHVGLLIYQGGQWPADWNGRLLTANFHGRRFNVERLLRRGSGYVGRREPDAFLFADPWFRPIDLLAAPDGSVFVSDWSDAGECHDNDGISRMTGRIFKLSYGTPGPEDVTDLTRLSVFELARLQLSRNDWMARQARRQLADRAQAGVDVSGAMRECARIEAHSSDTVQRLRCLWAQHVAGASDPRRLRQLMADPDEHVRAWALRLQADLRYRDPASSAELFAALPALAAGEESALVRLTLATLLQTLPVEHRVPLAASLLSRASDAGDRNLPLMLWYGVEPVAALGGGQLERLLVEARIPTVVKLGARRLAEKLEIDPAPIHRVLTGVADGGTIELQRAALDGVAAALRGRRSVRPPHFWPGLQERLLATADVGIRDRLRDLGIVFGDGWAMDELRSLALDDAAELSHRREALQSLTEARAPGLREICERLLRVRGLAGASAAGLAQSDDPAIADQIIEQWARVQDSEKGQIMAVLATRRAWSHRALDAIASGRISRADLSAGHVRQMRALADPTLDRRLAALGTEISPGARADPALRMETWIRQLTPEVLARADRARGRDVFRAVCAGCHRLNGEGGLIGPDLTGGNRGSLEYLLENILFPSSTVPDAYRQSTLTMKDGRVLIGSVVERKEKTMVLQTGTGAMALAVADVVREEQSSQSLMPEGILEGLAEEAARDLIAFLMSREI